MSGGLELAPWQTKPGSLCFITARGRHKTCMEGAQSNWKDGSWREKKQVPGQTHTSASHSTQRQGVCWSPQQCENRACPQGISCQRPLKHLCWAKGAASSGKPKDLLQHSRTERQANRDTRGKELPKSSRHLGAEPKCIHHGNPALGW